MNIATVPAQPPIPRKNEIIYDVKKASDLINLSNKWLTTDPVARSEGAVDGCENYQVKCNVSGSLRHRDKKYSTKVTR